MLVFWVIFLKMEAVMFLRNVDVHTELQDSGQILTETSVDYKITKPVLTLFYNTFFFPAHLCGCAV